ncbi:hypothetical protein ACFLZV_02800 [Candidatus Margulisiibacteriota bacterium]
MFSRKIVSVRVKEKYSSFLDNKHSTEINPFTNNNPHPENSCFLNTVLQIMTALKIITDSFNPNKNKLPQVGPYSLLKLYSMDKKLSSSKTLKNIKAPFLVDQKDFSNGAEIQASLNTIYPLMKENGDKKSLAIQLTSIWELLEQRGSLSLYQEQDAEECMGMIFDALNLKVRLLSQLETCGKNHAKISESTVYERPIISVGITYKKSSKNKYVKSIQEAVTRFFSKEKLIKDNQVEYGKKKVNAYKSFQLQDKPPFLVVHLKRYKHDKKKEKLENKITSSEFIYIYTKLSGRVKMRLVAIGHHTLSPKHYIAFKVDDNNTWYKFDDIKSKRDKIGPFKKLPKDIEKKAVLFLYIPTS